jgi:hypothetical protein
VRVKNHMDVGEREEELGNFALFNFCGNFIVPPI